MSNCRRGSFADGFLSAWHQISRLVGSSPSQLQLGASCMGRRASSSPARALSGDKLILSVDVDAELLCARHKLLMAAGYSVLSAIDGEQALELFDSNPVDLVLLDYVLPTMDGDLLAEAMKECKPHVPIIMVSDAYVPEESRDWVDRIVHKEEGPQVLLRTIRELTRLGREGYAI